MDDGTRTAEAMFRATIETKLFMLKMVTKTLALLIKHLEYLKAHNLKPAWKSALDKTQIKGIQALSKTISDGREGIQQTIKQEQRKLDKFTLDKKYELEQYQIKIYKAQRDYEIERDKKDSSPEKLKELQLKINDAKDSKREFEYEINKECMKKTQIIENYKSQFEKLDYDLKICNAKLNALYSDKNIETGRLNNEFQQLLERRINDIDNKDSHKIPNGIKDNKLYKVCDDTIKLSMKDFINADDMQYYEKINKSINSIANAYTNEKNEQIIFNKEMKQYIDNELNTDDNKEKKTYDRVEKMFSKEPEMIEKYKELENDISFKFTDISKDKETINL